MWLYVLRTALSMCVCVSFVFHYCTFVSISMLHFFYIYINYNSLILYTLCNFDVSFVFDYFYINCKDLWNVNKMNEWMNPDPLVFLHGVTEVVNKLKLWFNANLLFLNFSETEFVKFNTRNAYEHDTKILYDNMVIPNSSCIKFLGLNIVNTLSWKTYIDSLLSLVVHIMQSELSNHLLISKPCWWFTMLTFILLFAMAQFLGATLPMLLIFFACKRG
jgi:hypothetical protein